MKTYSTLFENEYDQKITIKTVVKPLEGQWNCTIFDLLELSRNDESVLNLTSREAWELYKQLKTLYLER
jgi:phosphoribosylformylglycinamidine (FGAM) synthase-like enzyme